MFSVSILLVTFLSQCTNNAFGSERDFVKVTTILNPPYLRFKNDEMAKKAIAEPQNDISGDIEGFLVDLLLELSKEAKFDYNIRLVNDGRYGAFTNSSRWTGMIGEVLRGDADLALADLTVTQLREEVVDFSYPFMTTGIGLLVKRPPYFENTTEENRTMLVYPVSGVKDLPFQNEVQVGCVKGGSTCDFFRQSSDEIFRKIGERFVANETLLSRSSAEGAQRVNDSNGKYAFFMEGAAIEYLASKNCAFMKLGGTIATRAYAIAMRKNFALKTKINMGLLALQERGILDRLKSEWFPQEKKCDDSLAATYARNVLNLVLRSIK